MECGGRGGGPGVAILREHIPGGLVGQRGGFVNEEDCFGVRSLALFFLPPCSCVFFGICLFRNGGGL